MPVRGSGDQIRVAVAGTLRKAFGGVAAAARGDEDEHPRSVEVLIPELSCSHLIGERGVRINALMEKTKCDWHIVKEPASGLKDQRRLRLSGRSIQDIISAVVELHEQLYDLARFGTLDEDSFSIKKGPTP